MSGGLEVGNIITLDNMNEMLLLDNKGMYFLAATFVNECAVAPYMILRGYIHKGEEYVESVYNGNNFHEVYDCFSRYIEQYIQYENQYV